MHISHLKLKNWRNFLQVDTPLTERTFLVGPNASGKSNLLDVFRFLRDIARPGGGVQKALADRGGLSKVRCLSARADPVVHIEIQLKPSAPAESPWMYAIGLRQEPRGYRRTLVEYERVCQGNTEILSRPNRIDVEDAERLTQSHLEQINSNQAFRPIAKFLDAILYLHLIPQLVRTPEAFLVSSLNAPDPYGRNFLEKVARTPARTRASRLRRLEAALRVAVPQLKNLSDTTDEAGIPHLEATYEHWRPKAGKQREDQFSDGTLRLVGLLWALLETDPVLLLEEPELSLNSGIVRLLPSIIARLQRMAPKQIILSTHSFDLLTDRGVGAEEVLVLTPGAEGTAVSPAEKVSDIFELLNSGMTLADALQPKMTPKRLEQLTLF